MDKKIDSFRSYISKLVVGICLCRCQGFARKARQNPSLLRKRILGCSSIFSTGKNPQCITVDTFPFFSRTENQISTQPPLSRYG